MTNVEMNDKKRIPVNDDWNWSIGSCTCIGVKTLIF